MSYLCVLKNSELSLCIEGEWVIFLYRGRVSYLCVSRESELSVYQGRVNFLCVLRESELSLCSEGM